MENTNTAPDATLLWPAAALVPHPMVKEDVVQSTVIDDAMPYNGGRFRSVEKHVLPHLVEPGTLDVICARGKEAIAHPGNKRLRALIRRELENYNNATKKAEKSRIVSTIVGNVRQSSPDGGFIRFHEETGKWWEVGDVIAREKVGQIFRDALYAKYKSSTRMKVLKKNCVKKGQIPKRRFPENCGIDGPLHTLAVTNEDVMHAHDEHAVTVLAQKLSGKNPREIDSSDPVEIIQRCAEGNQKKLAAKNNTHVEIVGDDSTSHDARHDEIDRASLEAGLKRQIILTSQDDVSSDDRMRYISKLVLGRKSSEALSHRGTRRNFFIRGDQCVRDEQQAKSPVGPMKVQTNPMQRQSLDSSERSCDESDERSFTRNTSVPKDGDKCALQLDHSQRNQEADCTKRQAVMRLATSVRKFDALLAVAMDDVLEPADPMALEIFSLQRMCRFYRCKPSDRRSIS